MLSGYYRRWLKNNLSHLCAVLSQNKDSKCNKSIVIAAPALHSNRGLRMAVVPKISWDDLRQCCRSLGPTLSSEPRGLQQLHHVLHLYEDVRLVTLHDHVRQRRQEVVPANFLSCIYIKRRKGKEEAVIVLSDSLKWTLYQINKCTKASRSCCCPHRYSFKCEGFDSEETLCRDAWPSFFSFFFLLFFFFFTARITNSSDKALYCKRYRKWKVSSLKLDV